MAYIGIVRDGRVELPPEAGFPDGTQVRVERLNGEDDPAYHLDELGVDADLPTDWARQHDHYIYGTPKREQ
jgi:hypothetical protein